MLFCHARMAPWPPDVRLSRYILDVSALYWIARRVLRNAYPLVILSGAQNDQVDQPRVPSGTPAPIR
jgi:hypothetical protein